jgi:U3 small nucleolar RNA-associated protein 12
MTQHKTKQLALVHVRTLKMTDDVLAVKYSPDGRYLAVSLLDSTVKIFFQDTLKFFLSLYGHKVCAFPCQTTCTRKDPRVECCTPNQR